jgi:PAS domain S-box-containing protein
VTELPNSLVLAPRGRDATIAANLLKNAGLASKAVANVAGLVGELCDDVTMILVTEEELVTADLWGLADWLRDQPTWSDLPIVVLTHAGGGPERNPHAARLLKLLGNVTFLERPFHPTTFSSVVKAAVAARYRQYDARSRLAELAENQESLRTALLAGRLGTWELDLRSMTLVASPTCKAAFGRGPDQAFGYEDLLMSVHPDFREAMQAAVTDTIQFGTDYQIEYQTIWPDGSQHWAEIHGRRIVGADSQPSKIVGVSSDITHRKTFEHQLLAVNESLEKRVADRTAALEEAHNRALVEAEQREKAEERLLQAQKVESIGQLTGGVAHDFNNLLMAVLGNLEVLRRHVGTDARAIRLIEGALEGARRGASLTQRLLAFARKQELEVKRYDLGELVSGITPLLHQSVGANIEIVVEGAATRTLVDVDGNQVELALLNLVVNARDAMPDGGTITISTGEVVIPDSSAELAAGRYIEIVVKDTGSGMDPETLRRAIEPFYSTKGIGKGTGLGLSMIHGLMLQLGGRFRLESTPGAGTTARMLFPTVVDDDPKPIVAQPSQADEIRAAAQSRVLVVDDDVLIAMSTAAMVEDLGHTVIEANSGKEALDLLRDGAEIDLMITDFSMPKMSGAELIQEARALRADLPIILASGYAELPGNVKLDVLRLGKPYEQRQLAEQINIALNRATM